MKLKDKILELKSNKIFGIGLPKTGTTSLNEALKTLGYRSLHYPLVYIYSNILSMPISSWETSFLQCRDTLSGEKVKNDSLAKIDHCFFGEWDALTNFGEHIYPSLDKEFPNSKFILTIRDKKSWLKSIKFHFDRAPTFDIDGAPRRGELRLKMLNHLYGCMEYDEEHFSILYDKHFEKAKCYFKDRKNDFLIIDVCSGEGWKKLCNFLEKDVLYTLFPDKNKTKDKIKNEI